MSFVPTPQANTATTSNDTPKTLNTSSAATAAIEVPVTGDDDTDAVFKARTFDLYWVDRTALMYKDGIAKTYDKEARKAIIVHKRKSSIPIILRDMAPPEGSVFDPAKLWAEMKATKSTEEKKMEDLAEEDEKKKKKSGGKKSNKKQSTAESIKESNAADKDKKDHQRDLQKLSNLRTLKTLQDASCETTSGKIHRMLKMLHIAVCDLKEGSVNSSEAEVLDILWALEEMSSFKSADNLLVADKAAKKDVKEQEKEDKKSSKKDSKKDKDKKGSKKDSKKEKESKEKDKKAKVVLTAEASALKTLYKEGADARGSYKDSLKHARKLMSNKNDIISFQLEKMHDRLPPLSRYNRKLELENWQCEILGAIDRRASALVVAPTSSGKTLLSTYTCSNAKGTVLFVLPSDALVWQIASMYYGFFHGNVTICTNQIKFQEITGRSQVYIGTPLAVEESLTKSRGVAGQEMKNGEREFTILDGGFDQFDYLVLDEVHTLNGPEGDALQRIIKCCSCPVLALSATIGNAKVLKEWFESVKGKHIDATAALINAPKNPKGVVLQEHFARFINLQRYVVTSTKGKSGSKIKMVKLHPLAAMTPKRLKEEHDLIQSLSMTPTDMTDLWKRMKAIFPSTILEDLDDPEVFFSSKVDETKRVTLTQTKEYETRLKGRLTEISKSHPDLYEKLRISQLPPPLEAKHDVSDIFYDVVMQMKQEDLLPAVAFQLDTYGAFGMFKSLLETLEREQVAEFPNYRKDLIKVAREKAAMRKVAAGKSSRENAVEMEEEAKSGFVDESLIQEDTTRPHDRFVLSSAGKRLSYNEVEDIIADMKKSGEKVDINHALIRGLRRGLAIFTNEVGFSCYRRQVQMLAQKGRIAVVFSDSALAYGVNMPFRSCIFCGDMGDALTPLIAQQMQGRAGRRGMDVKGNVIYLGMDWEYIENLMLGQISKVTGKEPRYPIMALQRALAASNDPNDQDHFVHDEENEAMAMAIRKRDRMLPEISWKDSPYNPTVTNEMMEWACETSLGDFTESKVSSDYYELSKEIIREFGFVDSSMRLTMDHNILSMVWELHTYLPEAIHLFPILEQMYIRFSYNKSKNFKESEAWLNEFISVLLHVVDRVPAKDGSESLQQMLRVTGDDSKAVNDDARDLWLETEKLLTKQNEKIKNMDIPESERQKMLLILPPASPEAEEDEKYGPPLDKGVYEMIVLKQKGFRDDQDNARRNELKERIVRLGQICITVHNNIQQPHGPYSALELHFRKVFNNVKYLVSDMMAQLMDQDDLTEV